MTTTLTTAPTALFKLSEKFLAHARDSTGKEARAWRRAAVMARAAAVYEELEALRDDADVLDHNTANEICDSAGELASRNNSLAIAAREPAANTDAKRTG